MTQEHLKKKLHFFCFQFEPTVDLLKFIMFSIRKNLAKNLILALDPIVDFEKCGKKRQMSKVAVSHILVDHAYEADDLLRKLQSGEVFENLARQNSKCSSASQGGSLGSVDPKRLDPDFREVLETLQVGEVSKPVRTRFGYHLIRRD